MKLYLIRHGQSAANANPSVYFTTPDSHIELTDLGREQATNCGVELAKKLEKIHGASLYTSPYKRTRNTTELICQQVPDLKVRESALLREQEHPMHKSHRERDIFLLRRKNSKETFFYKETGYESYCNVVDRISVFINNLRLTHKKDDHIVIVAHEIVINAFIMLIDGLPYEEMRQSVENCSIIEREL